MIRIRKITNPFHEANIRKIEAVKEILRKQFPDVSERKIHDIDAQIIDPLKHRYQSSLFIAEDIHETVKAFALLLTCRTSGFVSWTILLHPLTVPPVDWAGLSMTGSGRRLCLLMR